MRQVVVQPGQTLWSIASAAEPSADPRGVIEQIMSVNDLTSTKLPVGEEIWVPR
jgi:LysM repeat protein